tara:strand:+ start:78 stop:1394 length:1317 start_codon:yes stop_codon:yes gene_type:complete
MNRFLKYFILFLIGIILYYILNKQERFSIGIPIYRRNAESGLLEEVPEDEDYSSDSTILLEEETANHLNTIWPNHSVIDIIFDELKGWGELQKDEGMDDILLYLPPYVLDESENRFDPIENYMDLSEDEINKDYPDRIILTPKALDNIQTDPFWKEPKMLKALEASYGGSYHIVTLEDLPTFTIPYHVEHVKIDLAAFPSELPYQIVEGEGESDLQLNVNPKVLLSINCALIEEIIRVLVPVGDMDEITKILKNTLIFLQTKFSERGLSLSNETFMNWVFGFDDCKTEDDMDIEESSIEDNFLNEFRKKLSEIISSKFDYYTCASGLISPEYIIELQRRTQFIKEETEEYHDKSDWSLKSNEWFNTIISLYEPNYITIIKNIINTLYAEHDINLTDDQLHILSRKLRDINPNACDWHKQEMISHITKYIISLQPDPDE